jgi:hypothetical protein
MELEEAGEWEDWLIREGMVEGVLDPGWIEERVRKSPSPTHP